MLADGFCQNCSKFLCKSCCDNHDKRTGYMNHKILASGRRSNSSHADSASGAMEFRSCSNHSDRCSDILCLDHAQLLCNQCVSDKHATCCRTKIDDAYMNTDTKALQEFKRNVDAILKSAVSVKGKLEDNAEELQSKRDQMLTEAETHRDKTLSLVNKLYAETASEIKSVCQGRLHHLSTQKGRVNGIIKSLKKSLRHMERATENGDRHNAFIQMQAMAESMHQYKQGTDSIRIANVSFTPAFTVNDFRSWCKKLGNVTEELTKIDSLESVSDDVIVVMDRGMKQLEGGSKRQLRLKFMAAKPHVDNNDCDIVGMCLLNDGKLVIADSGNRKLNVVSRGNQLVSSLSLPFPPAGIAISGTKVAIATYSPNIYFVNIACTANHYAPHVTLEKSVLKCEGSCITSLAFYGEKLVLTSKGNPSCVKLIDKYGTIVWTATVNQTELFLGLKLSRELFEYPVAVVTRIVEAKTEVIVVDSGKRTITLMEAEKGDDIKTISTDDKRPACVTTDIKGKMYVSYVGEKQIDVWRDDVKSFTTVLHEKDLRLEPQFIMYDNIDHELVVCYGDNSRIERFHIH